MTCRHIAVDDISCPYCDYDILGDELYLLFVWEYFRQERNKYIDEKLKINPPLHFIHDVSPGSNKSFIDIIFETFIDVELQSQTLGFQ